MRRRCAAWRDVWHGVKWRGWRALCPMVITPTYIAEGGVIPFGYGVAWRDWRTDNWLCLPLGINLVAAWVRRAYHWLKIQPARNPSYLDVAFEEGRRYEREYQRQQNAKWDALAAELMAVTKER